MKKLVWTALVAAVSAGAAALAVKALRNAWMRVMDEPPPKQSWWARKLVGGPLSKGVETGIEPAAQT
jgi:hypothetical protein